MSELWYETCLGRLSDGEGMLTYVQWSIYCLLTIWVIIPLKLTSFDFNFRAFVKVWDIRYHDLPVGIRHRHQTIEEIYRSMRKACEKCPMLLLGFLVEDEQFVLGCESSTHLASCLLNRGKRGIIAINSTKLYHFI